MNIYQKIPLSNGLVSCVSQSNTFTTKELFTETLKPKTYSSKREKLDWETSALRGPL